MTSDTAFKQMIEDLAKRKSELHQHIQEFQHLEREISNLHHRARTDPGAQQKLIRVQAVMDGDFLQKRNTLIEKVSNLTSNMQTLTQLVQSIPAREVPLAQPSFVPKRFSPKKIRHSFM